MVIGVFVVVLFKDFRYNIFHLICIQKILEDEAVEDCKVVL